MPGSHNTSLMSADDLDATIQSALTTLDPGRKAEFLLDTALTLIDTGRYGDDVERYLDVYLKTPKLSKSKLAKALLARAHAREACGESLLAQAHEDFHAVLRLDPSNRDIANRIRRCTQIHFGRDPPSQRAPLEVWSRIADYIPRYHLRTWLFLSPFHRSIALNHIFHTIDLYFGEDQSENVNRSMDIFERVKADKDFSRKVKVLRVHWAYEEGELLDLMLRVFKTALPEFWALREFEWIGYPELRQDMVQFLLSVCPKLDSLGSVGFHFDACGISSFRSLKKLTLRAEDDDGYADWSEITTILDNNSKTLKHLTLGAYLLRQHSWDATFSSPTIHNLTHLDLVDTRISHTVLSRIAHAATGVNSRLESLTLHGILEEPGKAAVVFGSDEVINGEHTFLPRLKAFRFLLVGQPQVIAAAQPPISDPAPSSSAPPQQRHYHQTDPYLITSAPPPHTHPDQSPHTPHQPHPQDYYDPTILHLYATITHFLRNRTKLRRLDLGNCPWDLVAPLLPGLKGLRTIGVRIGCLSRGCGTRGATERDGGVDLSDCMSELDVLVQSLPKEVGALRVEVGVSQLPLHVYASQFRRFASLSFLHLRLHNTQPVFHTTLAMPSSTSTAPGALYPHTQPRLDHESPPQRQQQQRSRGAPSTPYHNHQQLSYQPFPPSSSNSSASVGGPGPITPKRRNGHKKDSVEHVDAEEFSIGPSSTGGGPSNAHVPGGPAQQHPPLNVIHHYVYPYPPYSQQHTMFPSQQELVLSAPSLPPPKPLGTLESAKYAAHMIKSLDFVGWNGELYIIVRNSQQGTASSVTASSSDSEAKSVGWAAVSANGTDVRAGRVGDGPGSSSTIGVDVVAPFTTTTSSRATMDDTGDPVSLTPTTPIPDRHQRAQQQSSPPSSLSTQLPPPLQTTQLPQSPPHVMEVMAAVELKELPSRRRLDCGKGVDLGGEDAAWLERKDVPMDYDMPVAGAGVQAN